MTRLAQLVWNCRAIHGMDKLVLMGWAEQVPDGSDLAYASKETVAEFLHIGVSTIQRHTKSLVKGGCLIDTGGQKQWKNGSTPVYQVNMELLIGHPVKLTGWSNRQAGQIDRQGTRSSGLTGVRSSGFSVSCADAFSPSTGVPPVAGGSRSKEVGRPEDLKPVEPKPKPSPIPHAQRKVKLCPKCQEPWSRDRNHVCSMPPSSMLRINSTMDEFGDMRDEGWGPSGLEARKRVETVGQKNGESIVQEGRTTATPAAFAHPPVAPAPPQDEFPGDIWDANGRTKDTPAGRAWAVSRGEEIIKPSSINP
jgi:hypothetical protein